MERVNSIDGLRALAMTMVIAQHCKLLPFGWTGVWLFFVISGFVITRGFLHERAGVPAWTQLRRFWLRRLFRIVPVYWLYVLVNIVVIALVGQMSALRDLPYLAGFVFNWQMIFDAAPDAGRWLPFAHLWTLSVEEQFYLMFPLLMLFVGSRAQPAATVALIAAGVGVRLLTSQAFDGGAGDSRRAFAVYASTFCHVDAFLMGSIIARMEPAVKARPEIARRLWQVAAAVLVTYVACFVGVNVAAGSTGVDALRNILSGVLYGQYREMACYIAVDLVSCAVLVQALRAGRLQALLSNRYVAAVGRISYGGYLYHALVLWAVSHAVGSWTALPIPLRVAAFVLVWVVTVLLAHVSFIRFELPVARWGRGLIERLDRSADGLAGAIPPSNRVA